MRSKLLINFPAQRAQEPVIYTLIKDFDLQVNILKANIDTNLAGHLLAEVNGDSSAIALALEHITGKGIEADFVHSTIQIDQDTCVSCGLCTSTCGTDALQLGHNTGWELSFTDTKCVGCNICLRTCPLRAISNEVDFNGQRI